MPKEETKDYGSGMRTEMKRRIQVIHEGQDRRENRDQRGMNTVSKKGNT